MKNKNLIYVAIGLGAGILAYYYFCKRKYKIDSNGQLITDDGELDKTSDIFNPTGRELAPPPLSTIINFQKDLTNSTKIPSIPITTTITSSADKPFVAPITSSATISNTEPNTTTLSTSTTPISSSVNPAPLSNSVSQIKPTLISAEISKPILVEPIRTEIIDLKTIQPTKVGFDGMGQMTFEVGECLNDL